MTVSALLLPRALLFSQKQVANLETLARADFAGVIAKCGLRVPR
jgi:hypothetical protein